MTLDTPIPPALLEAARQWNRLFWAQSLDGYVMLRWMRQRWNESLTRRLLLERSLIMLQPRVLGVEGLSDEELRQFLRGTHEEESYNLVLGVVGWDNRLRTVIPFCDLLSPYEEGTGWLMIPVLLRVEPVSLESLFEQMGKEAHTYYKQLSVRQAETLSGYKPAEKPFQVQAHALSEVLEGFARELDHEVLMELAPEREMMVFPEGAVRKSLRLHELANLPETLLANDDGTVLYVLMAEYLTEPEEQDLTMRQLLARWLESLVGVWRYEQRDGVVIARNLMAFLDRQYRYPLKELLLLERAVKQSHIPPDESTEADDSSQTMPFVNWDAFARFARSVYRQSDANLPALIGYRVLGASDGSDLLCALPAVVLLDRHPHRTRLIHQLCAGQEIRLPISALGIEGVERAVRLWRMNIFYGEPQPFGYWRAWHPDFVAMVRQGWFRYNLNEDGNAVFVEFLYVTPWQSQEYSCSIGRFPLHCPQASTGKGNQ